MTKTCVIARHAPLLSLRGAAAVARRSRSKLEHEIPRFTLNKLRNLMGIATPSARNDREGSHCEAQRAEAIPRSERMNQAGTKIPGTKF